MKLKVYSLIIVLLSLMVILNSHSLMAEPSSNTGNGIISSSSDPSYKPLKSEWTLERMQNAKPYPLPKFEGSPSPYPEFGKDESVGEPGLIQGSPGGENQLPEILENEETIPLGYPYPPPFTRYENFNSVSGPYSGYKAYPYRTVGVLYFTQNGIDYRCSASSIGNYAIWTAGHCVSDGSSTWSTDFLFIPAYLDGSAPIWWAQWTGSTAWTTTAWHNNGDLARDMGGVVLNLNATGKKVSTVGWLGFAWNWPRDQHWHEIGYPAASPFNGNRMIICASSHSTDDTNFTPNTMGTGCDQTPGCSGGPWIKNFAGYAGASNYLNGHFSYYYSGSPLQMYSPYFDDLAKSLWDALVNDVP